MSIAPSAVHRLVQAPSLKRSWNRPRKAVVSRGTESSLVRGARRGLRLTRRGRFVLIGAPVMVLAAAALVAGLLMVTTGTAQAGEESHPGGTQTVTVAPGDTLWDIAREAAPHEDPRNTMAQIKRLNGFDGMVRPGQRLVVPEGAGSEL